MPSRRSTKSGGRTITKVLGHKRPLDRYVFCFLGFLFLKTFHFVQSDFDWELSLPRWSNNLSNLDSLFSCEESADFFPTNYINAQNSFGNYSDYNSREIGISF